MSRNFTIAAVVVSSALSLAGSAQAGNKGKPSGQNQSNQTQSNHAISTKPWFGQNQLNQTQLNHSISTKPWFGGQQLTSNQSGNVQSLHCHKPLPLDPGKGDGKPTGGNQPPVIITDPVRVTSGGFVWNGDHWERQRANQTSSGPVMNLNSSDGPVVRDHRTIVPPTATSGFDGIVRDHRTTTTTVSNFNGIVRDHRTGSSSANGGVTVTVSTTSPRNNKIPTLSGPGPLDMLGNAASSIGSGLANLFSTEVGDASNIRDHRTTATTGWNVRDHR